MPWKAHAYFDDRYDFEPYNKEYRQCLLQRGEECQVTWLPADVATKGNMVRIAEYPKGRQFGCLIDNSEPEWSEGWEIISAGDVVDGEVVEMGANEWKNYRENRKT